MLATTEATDAALCEAVKRGRMAANDLVERHRPLVWKLVNDLNLPPQVDRDDLVQHGFLALVRAAEKWQPDKGTKFSSYAYVCILNTIRREVGIESKKTASLNSPVGDGSAAELLDMLPSPEPPPLPAEIRSKVVELPALYRIVVTLHFGLEGEPQRWERIAQVACLTVPQAKRALQMALVRLLPKGQPDQ